MSAMQPQVWRRKRLIKPIACTVISILILGQILRKIDLQGFRMALAHLHPGWFLVAIGAFSVGLGCGALRWRSALLLGEVSIPSLAVLRATVMGHFFNLLLFGPTGGDVVKSALCARWYSLPMPRILAASILDRFFSICGTVLFIGATLILAFTRPRAIPNGNLNLNFPERWWLIPVVVLAVVLLIWQRKIWRHPFFANLFQSLRQSFAGIKTRPGLALGGTLLALFGQICITGILALCLKAVTQADVPWREVLWMFPVISMLASIPITVAGTGIREGAAMILLGGAGVPAEDTVAAGLLTMAIYFLWGIVGAALTWREEKIHGSIRLDSGD